MSIQTLTRPLKQCKYSVGTLQVAFSVEIPASTWRGQIWRVSEFK